ncbi:MAG: DUF2203 domain-containing protein [Ignavibacteriaceae bacterium]|jgi:hypothetical protein|nr:DUF2203 domain-containing protein [Ignavibacteriaceae bacterium]
MTTETKYFTPAEARKTLPLVRNIVRDILQTTREMRLIADEVSEKVEDDERIKKLVTDVTGFLEELEEIGCYYKDTNFQTGLVDFPAVIDGEEVYLCWRSDEEDIKYYHKTDAGYAGRRLIPPQYFEEDIF